jgi:hypothetical protein
MFLLSLFTRRRPKFIARRRRPRRGWRVEEGVSARVDLGGATVTAAVANLTAGGACLALRYRPGVGDCLKVRLFNAAYLHSVAADARVRWCEPDGAACRVGCEFLRPLGAADLLPLLD